MWKYGKIRHLPVKGKEILELVEETVEDMDDYQGELKERGDEFRFWIKKRDGFHPGHVELYIDPEREYGKTTLWPSFATVFDRNRLSVLDEVGKAVCDKIDKATMDRQYLMFKEELEEDLGKVENSTPIFPINHTY